MRQYTLTELVALIELIERSQPERQEESRVKQMILDDLTQEYKDQMFELKQLPS